MLNRNFKDLFARRFMLLITVFVCILFIAVIWGLYYKSSILLNASSLSHLLLGEKWLPSRCEFGFFPFIIGTFWVTVVSMIIAVPLSLFTAIYLAEYAHERVRAIIKPFVDLLAAIPSVVYGIWGVLIIVPLVKSNIAPIFGIYTSGYCVLTGGIVLAIMVFPIIISISEEILRAVPLELREASLSLGATYWQTVKCVVLRKAIPGIAASVILGFARAFGETMAVMMVAGNVAKAIHSVFDPAYTLPSLIANNYGEIMSVPMYDSAIMFASFILLFVVVVFNIISRILLIKVEKSIS